MTLDGNKTYIIAGLIIVAAAANAFNYLSSELLLTVVTVLVGGGFATLRQSVAKVANGKTDSA